MSTKTKDDAEATTETAAAPKKSKKKLVIAVVAVLLLGGAGYWFFLKPTDAEASPKPGEVVTLDAIQINLEDGHYLRVGLALQLTESAHDLDGSQALDATIDLFSGREIKEVTTAKTRNRLKAELENELSHLYHGDVMGVYFTDFVTQ